MVEKMSFKIEDDNVLVKYDEIWNKFNMTLNIKFYYSWLRVHET